MLNEGERWRVICGDALEMMRAMPDNSVDAVVTDPPAGISFMGKTWDSDKGGRRHWIAWLSEVMAETLRLLKPGGHALVWALPRTSHWTAMALEDAGFEIRDCIYHLFGSGFPKSLDVSKAIDELAGAKREDAIRGGHIGMSVQGGDMNNVQELGTSVPHSINKGAHTRGTPITPEAQAWEGWGTALKPAAECWWLCRKPLSEPTVAANVLQWGTGALAIDACRIPTNGDKTPAPRGQYGGSHIGPVGHSGLRNSDADHLGRWPANLILDEVAAAEMDAQSGVLKSGAKSKVQNGWGDNGIYGNGKPHLKQSIANEGYASRFFYVAKASRSERGKDNVHPTVKSVVLMRYLCRLITPPKGIVLDCFAGSGSTGVAAIQEGFRFYGAELESRYVEIARRRLEQEAMSSQFPELVGVR